MEIKAFIDTLNPEQQQVAFDLLWQRLAADTRALDSPAWHGDVLAYVCLDMDSQGEVVYVNHDSLNARVLINTSVSALAESLCLYLTHRHKREPEDLLAAIGSIDPNAIAADTFWHHESVPSRQVTTCRTDTFAR